MDKQKVLKQISCLKEQLTSLHFPRWEEFPNVGLYMDQVTELVNGYFSEISIIFGDELCITPSMINNYVKSRSMPAPEKKKYSRLHLAYIIIICILKQTFSLAVIQQIFAGLNEENIKQLYNNFAAAQEVICKNVLLEIENSLSKNTDNENLLIEMISGVNIARSLLLNISAKYRNKVIKINSAD